MDEKTTLKTWTVMETLLGTIAFLIVATAVPSSDGKHRGRIRRPRCDIAPTFYGFLLGPIATDC
jgi:hypothetical protein